MENLASSNTLDIGERVKLGLAKEAEALHYLQCNVDKLPNNIRVLEWNKSTPTEDRIQKIDGYASTSMGSYSFQYKYRETGTELGLALIRPWPGFEEFKEQYNLIGGYLNPQLPWDRDYPLMYDHIDWYVFHVRENNYLFITAHSTVCKIIDTMLSNFFMEDKFDGSKWSKDNLYGAELRIVNDKGEGYSGGQKKLICYISPKLLINIGLTDYYVIGE